MVHKIRLEEPLRFSFLSLALFLLSLALFFDRRDLFFSKPRQARARVRLSVRWVPVWLARWHVSCRSHTSVANTRFEYSEYVLHYVLRSYMHLLYWSCGKVYLMSENVLNKVLNCIWPLGMTNKILLETGSGDGAVLFLARDT
jgi:hypothetical protein